MTWRALADEARAVLPEADARRIVERASGLEGADLLLGLDDEAPSRAVPFLRAMVERRRLGEPLQYVVGRWGFRNLDLLVDRRVLIPRPETETVVEEALAELRALRFSRNGRTDADRRVPAFLVDLGTGSGAIGLSLAVEASDAVVWLTDRSAEALSVARANLTGVGSFAARRVRLAEGSWYDALPPILLGRVQLIVANPPYVGDHEELPAEVADWEPEDALRAGPDGLDAITEVVVGAPDWLARPGVLVVEIAPAQAAAAQRIAREVGFTQVDVRRDLSGRDRALVARLRADDHP